MAEIKATIQQKTGTNTVDTIYPETTADQIIETAAQKVLTGAEREKLGGVEPNAQSNKIEEIKVNGVATPINESKSVNIVIDTSSFIANSQKGAANGVAELDTTGKVPASQLPSYVDDVVEYASFANFPTTGEDGKIYVAEDTNKTYRWGGSSYVDLTSGVVLGETSQTAYRGDRGKTAYDHSQQTAANPHRVTAGMVGAVPTGEVTTVATAGKLLKLNASAALPASITGNAETATRLAAGRNISITGDVQGSTTFDGGSNASITTALASSGIAAGTYSAVNVNAKGIAIGGGQIIEVGGAGQTSPSASLVIGGIFLKRV